MRKHKHKSMVAKAVDKRIISLALLSAFYLKKKQKNTNINLVLNTTNTLTLIWSQISLLKVFVCKLK